MLRQRQTEAEQQKQWIVLGGDWNGVTDPIRDRRPLLQRQGTHARVIDVDTEMQLFVERAKLFDPATRIELPRMPPMTFSQSEDRGIKSRIDYFLIPTEDAARLTTTKVVANTIHDHRMIVTKISMEYQLISMTEVRPSTRMFKHMDLSHEGSRNNTKRIRWNTYAHNVLETMLETMPAKDANVIAQLLEQFVGTQSDIEAMLDEAEAKLTKTIQLAATKSFGLREKKTSGVAKTFQAYDARIKHISRKKHLLVKLWHARKSGIDNNRFKKLWKKAFKWNDNFKRTRVADVTLEIIAAEIRVYRRTAKKETAKFMRDDWKDFNKTMTKKSVRKERSVF
jgi:hypothetical protein